jgi:hypothetical protein
VVFIQKTASSLTNFRRFFHKKPQVFRQNTDGFFISNRQYFHKNTAAKFTVYRSIQKGCLHRKDGRQPGIFIFLFLANLTLSDTDG